MTAPAEATSTGRGGRWGFLAVAVGLGVYGVGNYVFTVVAGRVLGPAAFAPLSVLWTLLNAVGIGLFLPFEQELGRTTAALRARGQGNAASVRAVVRGAGVLLGGVALLCLATWPLLTSRLFHDRGVLVPLLVGALAGMCLAYVVRGLLAGAGRYVAYGAQLGVDGGLRALAVAGLAVVGVRDVTAYGLVLVAAPLAAVLLTTRRAGLVRPGPAVDARTVRRALVVLVLASLASQVLANAGAVVVQLRAAPDEAALAGQFTAALTIARIPVFMFAAVQAVLLPGLASLLAAGDVRGFRRRLVVVGGLTAVLAGAGTLAVGVWGDLVVPAVFGDAYDVGRTVITLVALSGGLFMLAQVAAQALLALGGERAVVVGWVAGCVALLVASFAPGAAQDVAAVALVVGAAVALGALVVALGLALRGTDPLATDPPATDPPATDPPATPLEEDHDRHA